jgi:hypothetical protein
VVAMKVEVDKSIPIPRSNMGRPKYPWRDLKIGDSFYVPKYTNSLHYCAKRIGIKITTRKDAEGGIRVWRIK